MRIYFVPFLLLTLFACATGPGVNSSGPGYSALAAYEFYPDQGKPGNLLEKKIWFYARISGLMNQHRSRGPGNNPYTQEFTLDPEPRYIHLNQLIAYNTGPYRFSEKEMKGRLLKVYGILRFLKEDEPDPSRKEAPGEYYFDLFWVETKDE